ncbi:MAG: YIP1 family protein [Desulfarculaceae bacterium]|nr:YIP1 family protein [Desulfarculaceae bacterium]MCF8071932.1 YIP1 family protein [Desulfarculaceae bacterium]MCF8103732.1 YIP1 family protein [Desulfarculaceae bacterium]MCF8114999.1 YIP1 family protein [Desulfarculaceae bacterium]
MAQMMRDFDWRQPSTFLPVVMAAAFRPRQFFKQMHNRGDILSPLIFLLMVHLTTWAGTMLAAVVLQGAPAVAVAAGLLQNLLKVLIFAIFFYTIGHHVMRNPYPLSGFLRIYAYASGIWIVTALAPFLPLSLSMPLTAILAFYVLFLLFAGLRDAAEMSTPLAAGVLVLAVVGMVLLMYLITPAQVAGPIAGGSVPGSPAPGGAGR